MHDVAVLDDVGLAFLTQLTGIARPGFTVKFDEIIIGDGFGLNEAALKVGGRGGGGGVAWRLTRAGSLAPPVSSTASSSSSTRARRAWCACS